jgi:hypothetical protein
MRIAEGFTLGRFVRAANSFDEPMQVAPAAKIDLALFFHYTMIPILRVKPVKLRPDLASKITFDTH